jgi:CheY-like chemotaxis protein
MNPNKTVLIVDDDVNFSKMAGMVLEQKGGFRVAVCNQGANAVTAIREIRPDLILLDIVMPGVDGTDVAVELRGDPELRKIPLVFLTSLMTASEAAAHPVIANYKFISKPIKGEDLLRRVNEFFQIGH